METRRQERRYRRVSYSPEPSRREQRRSQSFENRRSPSLSLVPASKYASDKLRRSEHFRNSSQVLLATLSAERKSRRHKVTVWEDERFQRKKEGRKPFYLTLNNDGVPYGPGRPAWVAEVNKLAAGLDPSCTHIRKLTHEDMCILKDRLDDHFEYSRELNQDFLRTLLGKAVTRRRTDLISFIQEDGKQPLNFDSEIWGRLEKLAASKQRKNQTEHARYANACRRTMGRIGSLGMEGVRMKLSEQYGRSPDPDAIAEEMERDKGYGKKELHSCGMTGTARVEFPDDDREDEDRGALPLKNSAPLYGSEDRRKKMRQSFSLNDFERDPGRRGLGEGRREEAALESTTTSKDDYIAQLEAEIRKYRGDTAKGSSSRSVMKNDSGRGAHEDYNGQVVGFSGGKSKNTRAQRPEDRTTEAEGHSRED